VGQDTGRKEIPRNNVSSFFVQYVSDGILPYTFIEDDTCV